MLDNTKRQSLDDLDKEILRTLQSDGRISNVDLARQINLSAPAVHARIKRLEKSGYIYHYTTLLNAESIGYDMLCFIQIGLQLHEQDQIEQVRGAIQEIPEVLEYYHVAGEFDYLLKVAIQNRKDLERFVVETLTPISGVGRIQTSLVLSTVKSTTILPIK